MTRKLPAGLAIFSMALYVLWPLLATAQPRSEGSTYELCPHHWLQRFAEETGQQKKSPNPIWGDDQLRCVFSLGIGDGASAVPSTALRPEGHVWTSVETTASFTVQVPLGQLCFFSASIPRGPPAFS
jgi:hypothetical protein